MHPIYIDGMIDNIEFEGGLNWGLENEMAKQEQGMGSRRR
jgi:hypothetical protein